MGKRSSLLFAVVLFVASFGTTAAPEMLPESEMSDEQRAVWEIEKAIFAGRAKGDLTYYRDVAAKNYLGWPFGARQPFQKDVLERAASSGEFLPGEAISVVSNGISIQSDVAISYFTTHRTRRPGGAAVDERYENIHVFVRVDGAWRLIGSKSRPSDS